MKKLLFIVKLPPPVTGATFMNQIVVQNSEVLENFEASVFSMSYNKENDNLGKVESDKLWKFIKYLFQLLGRLIKSKPDLVYFQISTSGNALIRDALFVVLLKLWRLPVVYHVHAMDIGTGYRTWRRPFYIMVFRKANMIHLTSKSARDIPASLKAKVLVLPNSIPPRDVEEKEKNQTLQLLFLSNLMAEKGVLDVLEIAQQLKTRRVKFHLNIIGKEHEITIFELRQKIEAMDLTQYIDVLGPLYGDDKYKWLDQSDILVFPTYYHKEVFPLVILEAMQAGMAIVSYDHAGIPEIIDQGIQGFLAPARDKIAFTDYVVKLESDRGLLQQMGIEAQSKFRQQFDQRSFGNKLVSILNSI